MDNLNFLFSQANKRSTINIRTLKIRCHLMQSQPENWSINNASDWSLCKYWSVCIPTWKSCIYKLTLSPRKFLKHSPRNGSKTKQVHRTFLVPQCTVPLLTPPSILSGINSPVTWGKKKRRMGAALSYLYSSSDRICGGRATANSDASIWRHSVSRRTLFFFIYFLSSGGLRVHSNTFFEHSRFVSFLATRVPKPCVMLYLQTC